MTRNQLNGAILAAKFLKSRTDEHNGLECFTVSEYLTPSVRISPEDFFKMFGDREYAMTRRENAILLNIEEDGVEITAVII